MDNIIFNLTPEEMEELPIMDASSMPDGSNLFKGVIFDKFNKAVGRVDAKAGRLNPKLAPKPEPIAWEDFNKIQFPEQRWVIKNIIPQEGFVILASPAGEKKTWKALDMARAIATGGCFLGNENFPIVSQNVLYINEEMATSELQRRCKLLNFGKPEKQIWFLSQKDVKFYLANRDEEPDPDKEDPMQWFFDLIDEKQTGVVFIDTLRAVAGGLQEEKAENVRAFFDLFKPLKDKGVAVVFLDHCRKPQRFEGKIPKKEQLLGSQDKAASVEILLMLRSEASSNEIEVYQNKNRLKMEIKPFKITMVENEEKTELKLTYGGDCAEDLELKKDAAKDLIFSALAEGGKTTKELIEIGTLEKIGERNIKQAARDLQADKQIEVPYKKGRENYYILAKNSPELAAENDWSPEELKTLKQVELI